VSSGPLGGLTSFGVFSSSLGHLMTLVEVSIYLGATLCSGYFKLAAPSLSKLPPGAYSQSAPFPVEPATLEEVVCLRSSPFTGLLVRFGTQVYYSVRNVSQAQFPHISSASAVAKLCPEEYNFLPVMVCQNHLFPPEWLWVVLLAGFFVLKSP
jgi:hypothetical protein